MDLETEKLSSLKKLIHEAFLKSNPVPQNVNCYTEYNTIIKSNGKSVYTCKIKIVCKYLLTQEPIEELSKKLLSSFEELIHEALLKSNLVPQDANCRPRQYSTSIKPNGKSVYTCKIVWN